MSDVIRQEIRIAVDKLKTDVSQVNAELGKIKKTSAEVKASTSQIGDGMAGALVKFKAITGAVKQFVSAMSQAIKATTMMIRTNNRLEGTLKGLGIYSKALVKDFNDFATGIQRTLNVSDDVVKNLINMGLTMGVSEDKIKDVTTEAIALATVFDKDVNQALRLTAAAAEGNYDQLARYVPAIREASTEEEKRAIYLKTVAVAMEATTKAAQSQVGTVEQAKQQWGEFQKVLGQLVLNVITPLLKAFIILIDVFKSVPSFVQLTIAGISALGVALGIAAGVATVFGVALNAAFFGIPALIAIVTGGLLVLMNRLQQAKKEISELDDATLLKRRDSAVKELDKVIDKQIELNKKIRESSKLSANGLQNIQKEIVELAKSEELLRQEVSDTEKEIQNRQKTSRGANAVAIKENQEQIDLIKKYREQIEEIGKTEEEIFIIRMRRERLEFFEKNKNNKELLRLYDILYKSMLDEDVYNRTIQNENKLRAVRELNLDTLKEIDNLLSRGTSPYYEVALKSEDKLFSLVLRRFKLTENDAAVAESIILGKQKVEEIEQKTLDRLFQAGILSRKDSIERRKAQVDFKKAQETTLLNEDKRVVLAKQILLTQQQLLDIQKVIDNPADVESKKKGLEDLFLLNKQLGKQQKELKAQELTGFILTAEQLKAGLVLRNATVTQLSDEGLLIREQIELQRRLREVKIEQISADLDIKGRENKIKLLQLEGKFIESAKERIALEKFRVTEQFKINSLEQAQYEENVARLNTVRQLIVDSFAGTIKLKEEELAQLEQEFGLLILLNTKYQDWVNLQKESEQIALKELSASTVVTNLENISEALNIVTSLWGQVTSAIQAYYNTKANLREFDFNEEINAFNKEWDKKKEIAEAAGEDMVLFEANRTDAIDDIHDKQRERENKEKQKEFENTKRLNKFETLIAGANAAIQAYKSLAGIPYVGPVLGAAASAAVAGVTAAKISFIDKQQYVPRYEHGGIVPGQSYSGDKITARLNSGEMVLNKNQQSELFKLAQGGGGEQLPININIGDEPIGKLLLSKTQSGEWSISQRAII